MVQSVICASEMTNVVDTNRQILITFNMVRNIMLLKIASVVPVIV